MTVIRSAIFDDAAAIAHVHVEAWRTAYREIMPAAFLDSLSEKERRDAWHELLTKDAPEEFNIVAESDGSIVGFARGGPERTSDPDFAGELYGIYLLEEFRGRGIGRALFQTSAERLITLGMDSMKVWVLRDNPSRAFYERLGGVLVGEGTHTIGEMQMPQVAYGWTRLIVPSE